MKPSDDYALLFLWSQMFLLNKSFINSMWSHSEMLLHVRQSHTHTRQGLFLLHFWAICYRAAVSFLLVLLVSFQLTTCIMPSGHPSQLSELRPVYLYFMLLFSSHCYGFGFIPTSCKLNQTKLFMLARNYPQLIFHQEIQVLRN